MRTLISDFESKTNWKLQLSQPADCNVIGWLAEYAGALLRRFSTRPDGATPLEALKGRKSKRMMVPFGERVWWRPLRTDGRSNLEARVEDGHMLGIRDGSDEIIVATAQGLTKCRDINRRPWSERWDATILKELKASPWEPNPGTGDMRISASAHRSRPLVEKDPQDRPEGWMPHMRRMQIRPF